MESIEQKSQIREIIERLIGPGYAKKPSGLSYFITCPIDLSRPNSHDSKKEFSAEQKAVEEVVRHLQCVIDQVLPGRDEPGSDYDQMLRRLCAAVDERAQKKLLGPKVETVGELIRKNIASEGFFINSLLVVADMLTVYKERLKDLDDEEKEFWSLNHRAPNYYARTIALRIARLYAKETRTKPTFGTARDGNHPSTDFGRALEEVYAVLEIDASVRNAATWAIEQLTDDDLNPPSNALRGGQSGLKRFMPKSPPEKAGGDIVKGLTKGA